MDLTKNQREYCYGRLFQGSLDEKHLKSCGATVFCEKNETLLSCGNIPEYCCYVESGKAVSFEVLACGEERLYSIFEKGAIIGLQNLVLSVPLQTSVRAFPSVSIRIIRKEEILAMIKNNPDFCLSMVEALSGNLISAEDQLHQTCSETASGKICELLLRFSDEFGTKGRKGTVLREKVSQQTIASMLGLNRVTVARTMKELRSLGLAYLSEGFCCLPDIEALRRYQRGVDPFYAVG